MSLAALPGPDFEDSADRQVVRSAGDITDDAFRKRLVQRTLDQFGQIDVLINDVGVGLYAAASTADVELAKRLFDTNVFGPLALTQLVIPYMRLRHSGTIVNIGSVGGRVALPWASMYCASKFAVHAVSDALRRELSSDGIRVMRVCPGIVDTKFREHVLDGKAPQEVLDIRRIVSPDQVARALFNGIHRGARTVYVPFLARVFMALEGISPRIMDAYIRRQW
jgi:short-subunit dehydrogenase